jgi:hypothetical protein
MNCNNCGKMLKNSETSNKVLKDIGLESNGKCVRIEVLLCDTCYGGIK